METGRSAGVLLHITSLPGRYGTGTLGDEAYEFIDLLHEGGFTFWQILPTGPVSPSMCWSPYSSLSSFAGNELFISPDHLARESWFRAAPPLMETGATGFADFGRARENIRRVIIQSFDEFLLHATDGENREFSSFCQEHDHIWLDDYALYIALSHEFNSYDWFNWNRETAKRDEETMSKVRTRFAERILLIKFGQFIFFRQWKRLKDYAGSRGVRLIGDIPFYMSMDSADAWTNSGILDFDSATMKPLHVAGVPPDYFSETGQLWGNPVYRWHKDGGELREDTCLWWEKRIRHMLGLVDMIRIDHFRGFESFWSVGYGEDTAMKGKWVKGPGRPFFDRIGKTAGDLPFIAEDLGMITPEVRELRESLGLPGMKIIQFAFDFNSRNEYLPHNIRETGSIVYTGTHDNDTINGWFYDPELPKDYRDYVMDYLGMTEWSDFHWRIIREAYATQADLVIIPVQDILGYGSEFRMNTPGTVESKNWTWMLTPGALTGVHMSKMQKLARMFSRLPEEKSSENGVT